MNQTRKKRMSKKTRKSWRKHVDSQDVEKFMDKVRQDERLGSFAHKKDSELFEIDTKPNENILPKSLKRCLLKSKEPKCFAILKPQSAVQDPITKRNRVRTKEERMNKLLLKKIEMRKRLGILKKKEITAMKDREAYEEKRKNKEQRGEFKEDVWRDREKEIFNDPEFVSDEAKRHTMIHLGERKRRSLIRKRTSVLPAIVSPHPGTSYNPSYEDHQKLLLEVAEKEKKLIKEEEHLERVTTKMFKKVSEEEKQSSYVTEMSEGLNLNNNNNNNNNDNNVNNNNNNDNNNNSDKVETENPEEKETSGKISVNPPVTREKKTKTQRRKQKEQKELLRQIKEKRIEKKKTSDIYKLKLIKKQMEKEDKKQNLNKEKKMKKLADKDKQTKQLSKLKFEEPDMDFAMAEDITGNLRNTSTIGNLLKDRFLSMQQRNILAPSMMRTKPRGKVKRFTKPDHKIDVSEFNTNPQLRK